MSSAIISSGRLAFEIRSSSGTRSLAPEIFSSSTRMSGRSSTHSIRSGSVTKCALMYPRSNCMPSTTLTSVARPLPSSTVMTPSLPTFVNASASILPISASPLALMLATWATSSGLATLIRLEIFWSLATTPSTAFCMPRARAIASAPAVMFLRASLNRASAMTVAVVVPSPATSLVLEAASFTSWAPMFSHLSRRSISSATVTPSLVIVGAPQPLSRTALRPRGPRVDLTARASFSTPASSLPRASSSKAKILAGMLTRLLSEQVIRWSRKRARTGRARMHTRS